jgi:alcohol dehydrogenase
MKPESMKAAVLYSHGEPESLVLEDAYTLPPLAPDEVLLRVEATSLNFHDVFTCRGMPGVKVPMPCIPGLDFSGEIVEIGREVTGWRAGDRVLVDPLDRSPKQGGLIGEMRPGGLAQFCAVPAHHLLALPAGVDSEVAAALPVAYGTAHRLMHTIGKIAAGEKVLILGASGGVGTCCVQLAKLAGAEVIACASSAEKLAQLKALGADHLIDYSRDDFVERIHTQFGKPHRRRFDGGVDVVVNFTGGPTWVKSLKVLRRQGRVLTCGATAGYDPVEDLRYIWTFELQILGSNGWARDDLESLFSLVADGRLAPPIHGRWPLSGVRQAFAALQGRTAFGKVLVLPPAGNIPSL